MRRLLHKLAIVVVAVCTTTGAALLVDVGPAAATDTVAVTTASSIAGATTSYTVTFTEDNAINGGDSIKLAAPSGTTLSSVASDYFINNASSRYVPFSQATLSNSSATVTLTVPTGVNLSSPASSTIIANNVVNPSAGSYGDPNGLHFSTTQNSPVDNTTAYVITSGSIPTVACAGGASGLDSAVNAIAASGGTLELESGCTYSFSTVYGIFSPQLAPEALPEITGAVTIIGNNATLDATATGFGFFDVSGGDLTLDNMTLSDSNQTVAIGGSIFNTAGGVLSSDNTRYTNDTTAGNGGAVNNGDYASFGAVGVHSSTFTNDSATGCDGGAIGNGLSGGTGFMVISNATFSNNSACQGGSIDNGEYSGGTGTLIVTNSAFTSNTANSNGGAINSGGNTGTGTLTVSNSTFNQNTASVDGGAIDTGDLTGTGTATISNSTFEANVATSSGGAIANGFNGSTGSLTLTASTLMGNTGNGAADDVDSDVGTTNVAADLFADHCDQAGGTWTDSGYNAGSFADCLNGGVGDIENSAAVGTDLGALAANGGPTQTVLPTAGNPAIGMIPNPTSIVGPLTLCPTTDQRGIASGGACSAGAVQLNLLSSPTPVTTSVTTLSAAPNPAPLGQAVTIDVTVTGSSPTGTVLLSNDSALLATLTLASGAATYTTSALAAGTHPIFAIYEGDGDNASSESQVLSLMITLPVTATTIPTTTTSLPTTTAIKPPAPVPSVLANTSSESVLKHSTFVTAFHCSGTAGCAGTVELSVARPPGYENAKNWVHLVIAKTTVVLTGGTTGDVTFQLTAFGKSQIGSSHDIDFHTTMVIGAAALRLVHRFSLKLATTK